MSSLSRYSNKGPGPGQAGVTACLTFLLALAVSAAGCTSAYHQAREHLPSEPAAELKLRLEETSRAEARTERTGADLLKNLRRRAAPEIIEADFDRVEAAAFDFERRILAAREAAERSRELTVRTVEMDDLSRKAARWLAFVSDARTAADPARVDQLEELLR